MKCRTDYPYTHIMLESSLSLAEYPDKDQTWPNVFLCLNVIKGTRIRIISGGS